MPAKGQRTGYLLNCDNCGKEVSQTKRTGPCTIEKQVAALQLSGTQTCPLSFHKWKKISNRQKEWQKTNRGAKNPKFKGKVLSCDWCGKTFERGKDRISRYKYHFCSVVCKKRWYANIYSQSKEWKEESRIRATKILKNNTPTTQTKPQVLVNSLLDNLNIRYENEKNCKYYSIDNYLVSFGLMIEVMGDFWHCSPLKFKTIEKDIHKKVVPRDKAKHTYIKKYYNIDILYLWEYDIYHRIDVCKKLILEYINCNGSLPNYNSFNYEIVEGELKLKEHIIKSHQEISVA